MSYIDLMKILKTLFIVFSVAVLPSCTNSTPGTVSPAAPAKWSDTQVLIPVFQSEKPENSTFFKNFTIPNGVSAYQWTSFSLSDEGSTVTLQLGESFQNVRITGEKKHQLLGESISLFVVDVLRPEDTTPAKGVLDLEINPEGADQRASPLNALLELAARKTGLKKGWVKITDLKITDTGISSRVEYR